MPRTGRPTNYNKTMPKLAGLLASQGLSVKAMCAEIGIVKDTYYRWCEKYPEFSDSIARGKLLKDDIVEGEFYKRAVGYDYDEVMEEVGPQGFKRRVTNKHVPADVNAQKFWLVNRKPERWKNMNGLEIGGEQVTGIAGVILLPVKATPEEWQELQEERDVTESAERDAGGNGSPVDDNSRPESPVGSDSPRGTAKPKPGSNGNGRGKTNEA